MQTLQAHSMRGSCVQGKKPNACVELRIRWLGGHPAVGEVPGCAVGPQLIGSASLM